MVARSSVGDAVYRTLLRLYPARFQEDFAPDMALDFADASDDAWRRRRWPGLVGVWTRLGLDLARSLALQWLRTRLPLIALVALGTAFTTASLVFAVAPDPALFANVTAPDRDLALLILLTACVLLIIAATIILTVWVLRPLRQRKSTPVPVNLTGSLRI